MSFEVLGSQWIRLVDKVALGQQENLRHQGLVPERPISITPGLKFGSVFVFYILIHFVLSLLYLVVKAQLYFVNTSCMFLDKKMYCLKISLILG